MTRQVSVELSHVDSVVTLRIPAANLLSTIAPSEVEPSPRPESEIVRAMHEPIGQPRLRDMVTGREKVIIVVDDFTRQTPADLILPRLLDQLNEAGIVDGQIGILIALGTHRSMSREEISRKYGAEVSSRIPIENHDWLNRGKMVDLGTTPYGVPVAINREVAEAQLVIGVGSIAPHHLVGYSGGAKIIQPGVSGLQTTAEVHLMSVRLRRSFLGRIENPVRREIDTIGRQAGLRCIFNTVVDRNGELVRAFFGDPLAAFLEGVTTCQESYTRHLPGRADIVVASSTPCDVDFWQAHKALYPADIAVGTGGTIILVAPCSEGMAPTHPSLLDFACRDPEEIDQEVRHGTIKDGTAAALAMAWGKIRHRARISLVSHGVSNEEARALGFSLFTDLQDALDEALHFHGPEAMVTVLDRAPEIVPVIRRPQTR